MKSVEFYDIHSFLGRWKVIRKGSMNFATIIEFSSEISIIFKKNSIAKVSKDASLNSRFGASINLAYWPINIVWPS